MKTVLLRLRKQFLRKYSLIVATIVLFSIVVGTSWVLYVIVPELEPIALTPETTYTTNPFDSVGILDFEAPFAHELYPQDGPNRAERALLSLRWPVDVFIINRWSPDDEVDYLLFESSMDSFLNSPYRVVPWKTVQWKYGSKFLKQGSAELDVLHDAWRGSDSNSDEQYEWNPSRFTQDLGYAQTYVKLVQVQATLHFGNKKWEKGLDQLRILEWLTQELRFYGLAEVKNTNFQPQIRDSLFCSVHLSEIPEDLVCQMADELQAAPVDRNRHLLANRLDLISQIYHIHDRISYREYCIRYFWQVGKDDFSTATTPEYFRRFVAHSRDWNGCLRRINTRFDELQTLLPINDWAAVHTELLTRGFLEHREEPVQLSSDEVAMSVFNEVALDSFRESIEHRLYNEATQLALPFERQADVQMTRIGVRLGCWRRRYGEYPRALRELCTTSLAVPLDETDLIDPFSGQEFFYQPEQDFFDLRSAGPDRQFSEGTPGAGFGDDISFENPMKKKFE